MKKFYHLIFLLLLTLGAAAQPYGNEWINYSQQYYKFPITKAGVYRIDSTAMANAGINTVGLNPQNFQIFGRSEQLNVFVKGEDDGTFNNGDYIEFYAEGNDGWLDSLIYAPGQKQANPYWSLFTDTAYYYLSWNTAGGNQRLNTVQWQNNNGLPLTTFFIREYVDIRDNPPALSSRRYRFGELDAINGTNCEYITGECWAGARITANNGVVSGVPAMQTANAAANTGINAEYEAVFVSLNNVTTSFINHRYKLKFGSSAEKDTSFHGYQMVKLKIAMPATSLGGTTTQATWTYLNVPPATGAQSALVYQKLRYPHTYNLENAVGYTMYVPDNANNTSAQINVTNFNNSGSPPIIYDITNGNRINPSATNSIFSFIAPNGNVGNNKFFVTSEARVTYITGNLIKPVNADPLRYAQFNNYESEMINHDFLIVTHKTLMPSAQQYKTYKNLRGFNAVVIDIDDLYDQFAAGVKKNPLSMRRFAEYALDNWAVKPKYLFMIGKSVEPTFWRIGNDPVEFDSYNQNLVPSFGYPPSDVAITSQVNGSGVAPALMTGRLSTPNNTEIDWYLDKVMQYESNNPAEWMKNVAHFAGGTSQQDVDQFLGYLNNYRITLEDTLFGGTIKTFTKATSDPIDISLADSVRNLVNGGVSIMNFFGHASGNGFDISMDEPSTYDNVGKYPLMIGNSCFAGDIHQPRGYSNSTSESWISIQNKGAIAFLASITLGVPPFLNVYSRRLVENISYRKYGQSIGASIKDIGDYFVANGYDSTYFLKNTFLEMTLNGDPSLVINSFPRPDYEVTAPGVYFDPGDVTTDLDTFKMNVVIANLGRAVADTFILDIRRQFPSNADTTYKIQVANVYYKDTITVKFPVDQLRGVGINTFTIRADFPSAIDEMNEFNNDVITTLNIRSTEISPVYPYDYAIVPSGTITLKGSTYDPFAPERTYRLQVDTTDLFLSPIINTTVTQAGGVVNFPVNLTLPDSTVYFWRISPEPAPGDTAYKWREQSFQVISGLTGWSQDHFFQFKKDQFNLVKYDRPDRLFKFFSGYKTLTANNKNFCNTNNCFADFPNILYKIDVDVQDYDGYLTNNAIHIAVIDSLTLEPWGTKWTDTQNNIVYNPTHAYGQINGDNVARQRVEYYFIFRPQASVTQKNNMLNMLHAIPKSAYVLAYSWNETMFGDGNVVGNANWNEIKTFFRDSLHASGIDTVGSGRAWIFFGKKNDPSVAQQVVSDTIGSNEQISLTAQLPTDRSAGNFTSTKIGPAQAWNTLKWRSEPGESNQDTIHLKIIGVQANGQENVLVNALTLDSATFNLSTVVNSSLYPYLKLNAYMRDDSVKTPMQLDRWQVYYTPYPEFAVNPLIFSQLDSTHLQEGEDVTYRVTAENVTPFSLPATDSLKVNWWVFDANNVRHDLPLQKIKPIAPNDVDTLAITNTTIGYKGLNTLWLELNAFGAGHRVEPYHFNNYATRQYEISGDKINPLLDVTFDGLHVMDGDIISPRPQVIITLKDENRFLALDTASFKVFLTDPNGNQVLIPYINNLGEVILDFTPPNLPANNAKIGWAPVFTVDGKYSLLVQAKDKSGNVSGKYDYRITFEVINKATITQVMNYPNPFSDRTKFVFTLTGVEVPTYFKIQIMTITGKVVREINVDELGPIHIGRNITEYAWDGRDEFGDQLANGVYLYRVVTKLNGETIERRDSGADNWFKQGFGKMYLMR